MVGPPSRTRQTKILSRDGGVYLHSRAEAASPVDRPNQRRRVAAPWRTGPRLRLLFAASTDWTRQCPIPCGYTPVNSACPLPANSPRLQQPLLHILFRPPPALHPPRATAAADHRAGVAGIISRRGGSSITVSPPAAACFRRSRTWVQPRSPRSSTAPSFSFASRGGLQLAACARARLAVAATHRGRLVQWPGRRMEDAVGGHGTGWDAGTHPRRPPAAAGRASLANAAAVGPCALRPPAAAPPPRRRPPVAVGSGARTPAGDHGRGHTLPPIGYISLPPIGFRRTSQTHPTMCRARHREQLRRAATAALGSFPFCPSPLPGDALHRSPILVTLPFPILFPC